MSAPGRIVLALASVLSACDGTPVQPEPVPQPRDLQVFEDRAGFEAAVSGLGTRTVIDFEDVDPGALSGTISGRPPFDGTQYAGRGVSFSSPSSRLFIAPGGLFWNPTNSLSVGRFPFDSGSDPPYDANDDLDVRFQPGCIAAGFAVIDKGDMTPDDSVDFLRDGDRLLRKVGFPRAFVGMVAPVSPNGDELRIFRMEILETANDGDDVTYDDFICIR